MSDLELFIKTRVLPNIAKGQSVAISGSALGGGVTLTAYEKTSSNTSQTYHTCVGSKIDEMNGSINTNGSICADNANSSEDGVDPDQEMGTPASGPGPEGKWRHNRTWITNSSQSEDPNDFGTGTGMGMGTGDIEEKFTLETQPSSISFFSEEGGGYVTALTSPAGTPTGVSGPWSLNAQHRAMMSKEDLEAEAEMYALESRAEEHKCEDSLSIKTGRESGIVFIGSDVSALVGLTLMLEKPQLLSRVVCINLCLRPVMDGAFKLLLSSMRFCGMGSFLAKREKEKDKDKEKEKEKRSDRNFVAAAAVALSDHNIYWDRLRLVTDLVITSYQYPSYFFSFYLFLFQFVEHFNFLKQHLTSIVFFRFFAYFSFCWLLFFIFLSISYYFL